MGTLLSILLMIVIGAIIGGMTNFLAIKMLFRPYSTLYIAGRRLPFTPGLIPKRRGELAKQLGKTVMEHLLTPEGIQRKLHDTSFQNEMVAWAKQQARELMNRDESLNDMVARHFNVEDLKAKVDGRIETILRSLIEDLQNQTPEDLLPEAWQEKIGKQIPSISGEMADQASRYLQGPEGKAKMRGLLQQSLSGHGVFANMLHMFLNNYSMADKLQLRVVKLLKRPAFRGMVSQLLENEWEKVKQKPLRTWIEALGSNDGNAELVSFLRQQIPIEGWMETPLSQWREPYREQMIETWVPRMVDYAGQVISAKVGDMLDYLHLEEIVESQVETFAVERLERLVLSISRREFKMITYLGAFLGGGIGLIQGLLIQVLG